MYLDECVIRFKDVAFNYIPPCPHIEPQQPLEAFVEYHGLFMNKLDNKIKRRDGQNLDKCLYDLIFEKWGIDDSVVFKGHWEKIHDDNNVFTLVTIKTIQQN